MNESSRPDDRIVDDAVRRAYRDGATETAPERLNRRVLAEAEYAVALRKGRRWPAFRPLAWAATIGLSLVLVMQVTTLGPEPPDVPEAQDGDAPAGLPSIEALTDRGDESVPAAISPAEKRERLAPSGTMSAPAAGSRHSEDTRETAAAVAEEEFATNGMSRQSAPASSDAAAAILAFCDDEQRRDPASWRQCIVELLEAKQRERAIIEYELYREAYPEAPPIDL